MFHTQKILKDVQIFIHHSNTIYNNVSKIIKSG